MGASQSTGGVPIDATAPTSSTVESGVRVSGAAVQSLEDKIQHAFEAGKAEGQQSFQASLEFVAAQVYDNVHSQLANIQQENLKSSEAKSKELANKLSSARLEITPQCSESKSLLATCLAENKTNPLACSEYVNKFSKCASDLI